MPTPQNYDYIIVGGGAAGCLLANRLTADPQCRVLLLEAGTRDRSIWFKIPVGYRFTVGNPKADWCYLGEPEPGLNGRCIPHPRGKVLGGSTAINGMVVIRGQAADYDAWRDLGLPGWGWSDMLPIFKQHEDFFAGSNEFHAQGGEWSVDRARLWWPLLDAVREAAIGSGIPSTDDFNRGDNEGVGPIHVNQKNGLRWSATDGFLKPIRERSNLQIVTEAMVDRVELEGRRATGVRWRRGGIEQMATAAREVILAGGAYGSPAVLLRSGIGPAAQLEERGIATVHDLPGVGENLHDHLQIALRYRLGKAKTLNQTMNSKPALLMEVLRYLVTRRGAMTMGPGQLGLFARSRPEVDRADLAYNVLAFSRPTFQSPFDPFPGMTMIVYDVRPTSRGHLRLTDADPAAPPRIFNNFLGTERDRQVALDGVRQTRRIMRHPALAALQPVERWPGPEVHDDDEAALLHAIGDKAITIFHPVGTAKMGLQSDPLAVVDARLRVFGIDRLRVVDASVMPSIISGNTATPTLAVAEKGASMILADARP